MTKNLKWQTVSKKHVYESKWIKLRHDEVIKPDGTPGEYDVVEKKDFVLVIPKVNDSFYLVEQNRYPVESLSLEFPQGNVEPGETDEQAARREFEEETGFRAANIKRLGHLWLAAGHHTQGYTVYLVDDFSEGVKNLEGSEADMTTKVLTEEDLKNRIKSGEIKDASTLAAFTLYNLKN